LFVVSGDVDRDFMLAWIQLFDSHRFFLFFGPLCFWDASRATTVSGAGNVGIDPAEAVFQISRIAITAAAISRAQTASAM
jgi:hypothetical protein